MLKIVLFFFSFIMFSAGATESSVTVQVDEGSFEGAAVEEAVSVTVNVSEEEAPEESFPVTVNVSEEASLSLTVSASEEEAPAESLPITVNISEKVFETTNSTVEIAEEAFEEAGVTVEVEAESLSVTLGLVSEDSVTVDVAEEKETPRLDVVPCLGAVSDIGSFQQKVTEKDLVNCLLPNQSFKDSHLPQVFKDYNNELVKCAIISPEDREYLLGVVTDLQIKTSDFKFTDCYLEKVASKFELQQKSIWESFINFDWIKRNPLDI